MKSRYPPDTTLPDTTLQTPTRPDNTTLEITCNTRNTASVGVWNVGVPDIKEIWNTKNGSSL